MRPRLARQLSRSLVLVALVAARGAGAEEPSSPDAASVIEAARDHFETGIRLYREGNYSGALAEFEAAYELKPGPGSLQNIALCQKALLRYGAAADTLTRLLTRHDAELTDAERTAARQARDELEALVGPVRLAVAPKTADVMLDGKPLARADRAGSLRLNVGEHTLSATAPGYRSATTTFSVASGESEATVELALQAVAGFLDVRSRDPAASIAVDGQPLAFGHVVAPVAPNVEHRVQIYRDGSTLFEARVTVGVGETTVVNGELQAPGPGPTAAGPVASAEPNSEPQRPPVGWFALGTASALASSSTPFGFDLGAAHSSAWSLGVRAGKRVQPAFTLGGVFEYDQLRVRHACDQTGGEHAATPILCSDPNAIFVSYVVRTLRLGPALELMTTGPHLRAIGGISTGGVWHDLRLGADRRGGFDPYVMLDGGLGANTRHVLFALEVEALLDGTQGMIDGRYLGPGGEFHERAFSRSKRALGYVGLSLRVGYSQWAP